MAQDVTYSSYLDLDRILAAQHPVSGAHDEMLFIIVHQASELWLKLCLHELHEARECVIADDLRPAFKMLARVARAQGQLIQSWDVLSTMTPHDYSTVRPHLGGSSGFQSAQYRMMEFLLGGRNPDMVTMHEAVPEVAKQLRVELGRPSIYAEVVALLARRGFAGNTATPSKRPGRRSIAIRKSIGTFTNWRRSWSISNIISSAGGSGISRRWSGSSASRRARAARPACPIWRGSSNRPSSPNS